MKFDDLFTLTEGYYSDPHGRKTGPHLTSSEPAIEDDEVEHRDDGDYSSLPPEKRVESLWHDNPWEPGLEDKVSEQVLGVLKKERDKLKTGSTIIWSAAFFRRKGARQQNPKDVWDDAVKMLKRKLEGFHLSWGEDKRGDFLELAIRLDHDFSKDKPIGVLGELLQNIVKVYEKKNSVHLKSHGVSSVEEDELLKKKVA